MAQPTNDAETEGLYIDDGFTITSEAERVPGLSPRVRFVYRPATPAECNKYYAVAAEDRADAAAELIFRHVSSVRVVKADGSLSDDSRPKPDALLKLRQPVWHALLHSVLGTIGPVRLTDDSGKD